MEYERIGVFAQRQREEVCFCGEYEVINLEPKISIVREQQIQIPGITNNITN
jgi:hypothetical protein